MDKDKQVQDILVDFWNDIANRHAGEKLFESSIDIMEAYRRIMKLIDEEEKQL